MDMNHRPRQQSTSQPSPPSSHQLGASPQQHPADPKDDDPGDVHSEEVLTEARKNLQVLIDSGLSKGLLHELVDGSQALSIAAIPKQQSDVQQQKQQQPPLAPPTLFVGAPTVSAVKTPTEASTSSAPPAEIKSEALPEDIFYTSRSSSGLGRSVFAPPPAPSTSSGSSDYSSIWSTNSGQSSMSWQSASTYNRSQAPLPPSPSNPVSVPLGPMSAPVGTTGKANIYWCTSCETSFKRKYDWKRHEDEFHERWRKYPCPEPGCNCSFWGSNSFNQHHKQCHGCKTCPHAEKVVNFLRKRKYWACGFCSALHTARERHVEHVARHFESGMTKGNWIHSRVVHGLLHQPLMHEAWNALLVIKQPEYNGRRPLFSWHPSKTGRAQGFLENENPGQLQDLLEFFSGDEGEAQWLVSVAYDLADIVLTSAPILSSLSSPAPMVFEDGGILMGTLLEKPGVAYDITDTALPSQFKVPETPRTSVEPSFSVRRALIEAFPVSLPDFVNYVLDFLPSWESPVPPGKGRVRWKCKCGANLYDDFIELEPGSLKDLEVELQVINSGDSQSSYRNIRSITESFSAWVKLIKQMIQSMRRGSATDNLPIPLHNITYQANESRKPDLDILHLLCCLHSGETGIMLHQERIPHVSTDRELIMFLKEAYQKQRNVMPWLRLRHVSRLLLTRVGNPAS
ncbi:hypothetical protein V3481_012923 [Fusarium oxysporum f. sp. vasinfectum]